MKQCPVCDEQIPLRLLSKHAELESERVEQIIKNIGSAELPYDEMDDELVTLFLEYSPCSNHLSHN